VKENKGSIRPTWDWKVQPITEDGASAENGVFPIPLPHTSPPSYSSTSSPFEDISLFPNELESWSEFEYEPEQDREDDKRAKKIAKLTRTLGESVPPDVVFPVSTSVNFNMTKDPNTPFNPLPSESPKSPTTATNTNASRKSQSRFHSQSISTPASSLAPSWPVSINNGTSPLSTRKSRGHKHLPQSLSLSHHYQLEEALCVAPLPLTPPPKALLERRGQQQALALTILEGKHKDHRRSGILRVGARDVERSRRCREVESQREEMEETRPLIKLQPETPTQAQTQYPPSVEAISQASSEVNMVARSPTSQITNKRKQNKTKWYSHFSTSPFLIDHNGDVSARIDHSSDKHLTSAPACSATNSTSASTDKTKYGPEASSISPPVVEKKNVKLLNKSHGVSKSFGGIGMGHVFEMELLESGMLLEKNVRLPDKPHAASKSLSGIGMEVEDVLGMGLLESGMVVGTATREGRYTAKTMATNPTRYSFPARIDPLVYPEKGSLSPVDRGRRKGRDWSGEWNMGNMEEVVKALRELKVQ
jgi:hypothetical protein